MGLPGLPGIMGMTGATGTMGPIGLTGETGMTGTMGSIGMTGMTGTMGPVGMTGMTGTMGPVGLTGMTGTMGPVGLTGMTGTMGSIGMTGMTGTMGSIGLTGTMGPVGLTGMTGTMGSIGLTGMTGTMGASITNNNFAWAIKKDSQIFTGSVFNTILFTSVPELDGWIYASGMFTCNQSGKYIVSYTVIMTSTGGSRVASVRGNIDGTEIIGSAITEKFQSSSINQIWTNFFIMTINAGQKFKLEFAGSSSGDEKIDTTSSVSGETPVSSSIVITRIS
ncbi:MAG: hypothetical protein PHX34_04520 [Candidatus Shapirobacteria bacterium]|nr:hypothetical protein [Candidatus Shapirobacteria bacterium]